MPRKHIIISGRVQGVGFRWHARVLAETYHLTGWVCNMDSGDVELEVQGPKKVIEDFLYQLERRSMFIRIDDMQIEDCSECPESEFVIKY